MDNKNERNLNITLKNEQEEKDEVVISLSTIFKKLKKYFAVWLVAVIVSAVISVAYATVTTHVRKPSISALVSFSYDGIEEGKSPDGQDFDVYEIKDPSVIESAILETGVSMEQLEYIRQGISIKSITPSNIIDRLTVYESVLESNGNVNAATAILETSYYPTQYRIYFDYNNTTLTDDEAVNVFNAILTNYRDYFYELYGYNSALGSAINAIDYNSYDYSEAVEILQDSLTNLQEYVKQLSEEDSTRFRSSLTGYTFDDLDAALETIEKVDLQKITSYINSKNLTKDREGSIAYYDYRITALTRNMTSLQEQIAEINNSIEKYEKDNIIVFSNGGEESGTQYSMASEQYDNMYERKIELTEQLATTKQNINYFKERKSALETQSSGSNADVAEVEERLANVYDKISTFVDLVSETADDYYRNVAFENAYSILVPATSTTLSRISRVISNSVSPFIMLVLVCLVVYFIGAFIEALVEDSRKRKILAEAIADANEKPQIQDED